MDLEVPEYAYMYGFMQADGHLQQGAGQKGKLTVEINARDIEILREFRRLTPYNSTISERTRSTNFSESHRSATRSLCSLEARTTINQLGLPYGRKSKKIAPPRVGLPRSGAQADGGRLIRLVAAARRDEGCQQPTHLERVGGPDPAPARQRHNCSRGARTDREELPSAPLATPYRQGTETDGPVGR
ncbi:hypothetical protein [Streptomyces sp. MZ04]|uniref:hypothetical protein n=1 Tax=Streptomyces sp. MZ04 TaxID=2559236 RepID=UPI0032B0159F